MYSSREEATHEGRLARERPAFLSTLAAQLTVDIRRAGIVASLSPICPNPAPALFNLILERDCRKPAPNPANPEVDLPKPCRMCTYITDEANPFRIRTYGNKD